MKHILITTITTLLLVGCGNTELDDELMTAAWNGKIEDVKTLLDGGANVNAQFDDGTPLHDASEKGHDKIVRLLISKGANVNANNIGHTPLHSALNYSFYKNGPHKKTVEALIENGADINAKSKDGFTPLDAALLVERQKNLDNTISNFLRSKGAISGAKTSLLVAAKLGDVRSIKELIDGGAYVNKPTSRGNTLLHVAAGNGHKNAVELLLDNGSNINAINKQGNTPLFKAVASRDKETVELLIAKGANIKVDTGLSRLAIAYSNPDWSVEEQEQEKAERSEKIEMAKLLILNGVDVNKIVSGNTALHIATSTGNEEMAKLLIKSGSNINESNNGDQTPLHKSAFEGREIIVNLLIQNGANVNPVIQSTGSFNGMTPLDFALQKNKTKTADLLRKHGGKTGKELKAEGK